MNTKLTSLVNTPHVLARCFAVIFGCIAVWWGIIGFPIYWEDSVIEGIATRIIAGDRFKVETLEEQLPIIDSIKRSAYCRPAALRSTAIIQLHMVEVAGLANDHQHRDERLKSLSNVIRSSLSCAPADPFMWLALYSVDVTENGIKPNYLKYLRLSYRLGPHEAWIVIKRNPLVFKAFQQLPADLRETAIDEFVSILREDYRLTEQAVGIFVGPAWPERELILAHLTGLAKNDRQRFADALRRRGYDLDVPGIGLAPVDSHRFAPEIRIPE